MDEEKKINKVLYFRPLINVDKKLIVNYAQKNQLRWISDPSNNDEKIVKLFGRQTYPGSNKYEYYGITSDNTGGQEVKLPIVIEGDKELYDKDQVSIDFLDSSKGNFILYMNDYDRPRYNPFVIN